LKPLKLDPIEVEDQFLSRGMKESKRDPIGLVERIDGEKVVMMMKEKKEVK